MPLLVLLTHSVVNPFPGFLYGTAEDLFSWLIHHPYVCSNPDSAHPLVDYALRRQQDLSMQELVEMSGVSYDTVWRLENHFTGAQPRTIRKSAQVLCVDPAKLVKGEE